MKNEFVRWTQWNELGVIASGYIRVSEIQMQIRRFEKKASKVLEETGADHVVYAVKHFSEAMPNEPSELQEVRFHMIPLDDKEFIKRTSALRNDLVYALHRR